jgi:RES domain-containing protein
MAPGRVHDRTILDALEALVPIQFRGSVWRVAPKGRDGMRGTSAHGRWSPSGELEVLYTSLERAGALAEIGYRLSLEPVWPSRLEHQIHRIRAQTERTLQIADVAGLAPLGVDISRYDSFDYTVTQAVAAAAHFLEYDGLMVPSARHASANLVVFMDRGGAGSLTIESSADVDWTAWRSVQPMWRRPSVTR